MAGFNRLGSPIPPVNLKCPIEELEVLATMALFVMDIWRN